MIEKVYRGERVVLDDGVRPAAIHVEGGVIAAISAPEDVPPGVPIVDARQLAILPGVVDCHVHINEPGRTEWEGFETATRAAASGGITTLVDMPLNSIPTTTTCEAFAKKLDAAKRRCSVDVGFWGGLVPGNENQLRDLMAAGVLGFKCFLIDSGIDEFPAVTERDLMRSLGTLADLGAVLLVHAELPGPIEAAAKALPPLDPRSYRHHLASRPKAAENEAIELMTRMCREFRSRVHIVHHSSSEALELLEASRAEGLPLTVETCPHYLSFAAEEIPDGATHFKCTPPIRERDNRDRLWEALGRGVIDAVVSDHSPCSVDLKGLEKGEFETAWGGISSLGLTLSATWSGAKARGFGLVELARWMSAAPARVAGLSHKKGRIAVGYDADFAIFDPEADFEARSENMRTRHRLTPYSGKKLSGVVRETHLRGVRIFDGTSVHERSGKLLVEARR
jgi:allantoinase